MISSLLPDALIERPHPEVNLQVRKAGMQDISPILHLINGYAAKGTMLPRTEFEMSESIRDFSVAVSEKGLMGCGALHFYSPTTAEIRSLAVDEAWKTHGVGRQLIEALVEEAREFSLHAVFAFTYVPEFFRKMGFQEVERGALPLKAWKDCLRCPKFQCCDEIAVMRVLNPEYWHQPRLEAAFESSDPEPLIQLPVVRKPLP
ncbi:MAG TPA: N-acetyltransferase [Bryobacteraceae bacterium]|nr:N-acetyltransferase [Bryobacteraceae bacterium]